MIWSEFIVIAGLHMLAVISPGPDTAIVLNNAIKFGRRAGIYTAAGIACGIIVHVLYSVAGVGYLLHHYPWLQHVMMFLAAAYLGYIGISGLKTKNARGDADFNDPAGQTTNVKPFINGLITNGLNPKATLFFIALFTGVVADTTAISIKFGYGAYLVLATFVWFALLSSIVGHPKLQQRMQNSYKVINLVMSLLLIAISLHIVWSLYSQWH
ncbi:LysE family translocator [Neiella marina]|uniref:LysE family translocator n=1 Tax=Neiella holothuriorum TaxID=2870530 RepID=A0ABS7EGW4_9GAMM|nr:LysE family translocator [Neiella holothuriorum]MBW8191520.1 LysE family translocator [Neiella holothuriorum]